LEDAARLAIMFEKRMTFGLSWWKDSVQDAIAIVSPAGTAANAGDLSEYLACFESNTYPPLC
jgi:hypothetical protein